MILRGGITQTADADTRPSCERCHRGPQIGAGRWATLCEACAEHFLDLANDVQYANADEDEL